MRFSLAFFVMFIVASTYDTVQAQKPVGLQVDSLLEAGQKNFNGTILIASGKKDVYHASIGFSDLEMKIPIQQDDQFTIGSISKQITAVLILREYEKGHLQLHEPVRIYLPALKQPWADSVTIHHLLTHTHGIRQDLEPVLAFTPGTQFEYSNMGYQLLGEILSRVSGRSFADLSAALFKECKMHNSFHPALKKHKRLVKGYAEDAQGRINFIPEPERIPLSMVPAGGFISTATDMVKWNNCLHGGKLLADSTYNLMTAKQKNAVRYHPLFGTTHYGYGITIDDSNGIVQLGQTGMVPGFNSINFYYPDSGISMIVLNNTQLSPADIRKGFYYHLQVQKIVRNHLSAIKQQ